MRRVETGNNDRLGYRRYPSCGALSSALVLLFLLAYLLVWVCTELQGDRRLTSVVCAFALGGALAWLWGPAALGVGGLSFDRAKRVVWVWSGPLFPLLASWYRQEEFEAVHVGNGAHRRFLDHKVYRIYLVSLCGPRRALVRVARFEDYEDARRTAVEITRFLRFHLIDETGPHRVEFEAPSLEETLAERVRRRGPAPIPPRPPDARSRLQPAVEGVTLRLPSGWFRHLVWRPLGSGALLGLIVFGFLFVIPRISGTIDDPFEAARRGLNAGLWVGGGVTALGFVIGLFHTQWVRIEARPSGLRVLTRSLFFRWDESIPADQLIDLQAGESCLIALSDQRTICFAGNLSEEERDWVQVVLEEALAGRLVTRSPVPDAVAAGPAPPADQADDAVRPRDLAQDPGLMFPLDRTKGADRPGAPEA
jgi:hypothetical protein